MNINKNRLLGEWSWKLCREQPWKTVMRGFKWTLNLLLVPVFEEHRRTGQSIPCMQDEHPVKIQGNNLDKKDASGCDVLVTSTPTISKYGSLLPKSISANGLRATSFEYCFTKNHLSLASWHIPSSSIIRRPYTHFTWCFKCSPREFPAWEIKAHNIPKAHHGE